MAVGDYPLIDSRYSSFGDFHYHLTENGELYQLEQDQMISAPRTNYGPQPTMRRSTTSRPNEKPSTPKIDHIESRIYCADCPKSYCVICNPTGCSCSSKHYYLGADGILDTSVKYLLGSKEDSSVRSKTQTQLNINIRANSGISYNGVNQFGRMEAVADTITGMANRMMDNDVMRALPPLMSTRDDVPTLTTYASGTGTLQGTRPDSVVIEDRGRDQYIRPETTIGSNPDINPLYEQYMRAEMERTQERNRTRRGDWGPSTGLATSSA